MALLAVVAVAAATWLAAAAQGPGVSLPVLGALLATAVAGAAVRRSTRVLPAGTDGIVLTAVTVGGYFVLHMAGWTDRAHNDDVFRLLPWAAAVLGVLWPEPNVLRYCLLLACGTLLGAAVTGDAAPVPWAVGGAVVALALALVATNRLAAASGPRLGGPAPASGRRVAGEAAAVLGIVGLLAALAASLVPPPPGAGGGGEGSGDRTLLRPAAPSLGVGDHLDIGAGRGRRGKEVVLVVDAPAPDVWRAVTYDHWDGPSWDRSAETLLPVQGPVVAGVGDAPPAAVTDPDFRQWVTVHARSASILVAAPRPSYVGTDATVRQGEDASLLPTRPLVRGESYVAYSARSLPGRDALRSATGPVPADVAEAYLQLPALHPAVRALAADIAAGAPTTYDTVRALEDWLLDNTSVTTDARPVPPGADPLERFLLEDRSGPPERTATALAVMLRALGVPARVAVGFLPGTRQGPSGEFVVRLRDSHAWVEVWFPGVGWQRFDPTGKAPPPEPRTESVGDRLRRFLTRLWPLAVALVVVALAWAARWWRRRAARPWATRFLARMEREGALRGRPRHPQETPAEYAGGLSRTVLPDARLEELGDLVTVAAYSRHEPAPEERARAEDALRAAARASPVNPLRRVLRSPAPPRPTIRKP